MSFSAAQESNAVRGSCQKHRRRTTLCFECYRSERARRGAQPLREVARLDSLWSRLVNPAALTNREVAHRRRMLAHLRKVSL